MRSVFTGLFVGLAALLAAQAPAGYYNAAVGTTEAGLKTKLCAIVGPHTERTYNDLWTDFQSTDKRSDGYVWDMYSNCSFTFGTNQDTGSGGTSECQYYNREHSMPNSWFSKGYPMYTDLYHMYPTDKYVNNQRGNNPFGETTSPSKTFQNGSKLGNSTFAGYSGTVYEPVDEYKGDFARSYFYMVTAYDDKVSTWVSEQLAGNQYPALSTWSVTLLLKWNSQDPVSQKETDRNEAVYKIQGNRNPFIDHPELAEYIWGSHKGEGWSLTADVENPVLRFSVIYVAKEGLLKLDAEGAALKYALYNVNGQELSAGPVDESRTIKTSGLRAGMYLLKLTDGNKQAVQKFIAN